MMESLPAGRRFMLTIAALLAFAGGIVNAVAFVKLGTYVGNCTGTVTSIGLRWTGAVPGDPFVAMKLILSFMSGSFMAGILIPVRCVNLELLEPSYELVLFFNAALFVLTWMHSSEAYGKYIACVAMGLLNGTSSLWCGGMRTTHSTGTVTDLGLTMGKIVAIFIQKGFSISKYDATESAETDAALKKWTLMAVLLLSFASGGVLGGALYKRIGADTFLVAALITGSLGIAHFVHRVLSGSMSPKLKET